MCQLKECIILYIHDAMKPFSLKAFDKAGDHAPKLFRPRKRRRPRAYRNRQA